MSYNIAEYNNWKSLKRNNERKSETSQDLKVWIFLNQKINFNLAKTVQSGCSYLFFYVLKLCI